ncbi:hypothetical protein ACF1BN_21305 [Streptomyces sp. NPDC014861]|uniref:hypothetical protein n=1 Tax=Streptomyces sp. NPDC014861 TaxID=3364923 RepID=UPI0036FAD7CB
MTGPRHGAAFDAGRRRSQNALLGLVGFVALLAGAALLIGVLPRAVAEERAFLSAAPCTGGSTDDCLRTTWFTVDSVRVRGGRTSGGEIELSGPEGDSRTVKFTGAAAFLEETGRGDRVVGTSWRGSIVLLSTTEAEAGQRTDSHPVGGSLFAAGFGIVLALAGGLGCGFAGRWWVRRPDDAPVGRRTPPAVVTGSVIALGLYTFALASVLYGRDASLQRFFVLRAPAAGAGAVAVSWKSLRGLPRRASHSLRHREG